MSFCSGVTGGVLSFSGWRRCSLFMPCPFRARRRLNADGRADADRGEERVHHIGVELRAGAALHLGDRFVDAERGTIEAVPGARGGRLPPEKEPPPPRGP